MGYYELADDRKLISSLLENLTDGEIVGFDFFYVNDFKPYYTFLFTVPAKIQREYDNDMITLLNKHEETIRQVISSVGHAEIFKSSITYQVL